jgi:hypothetical protein
MCFGIIGEMRSYKKQIIKTSMEVKTLAFKNFNYSPPSFKRENAFAIIQEKWLSYEREMCLENRQKLIIFFLSL